MIDCLICCSDGIVNVVDDSNISERLSVVRDFFMVELGVGLFFDDWFVLCVWVGVWCGGL